jgi:hypothetical protein
MADFRSSKTWCFLTTFHHESTTFLPSKNHVLHPTPPGRGGIGLSRLSGPAARAIAEPLLKLRHSLAPAQARFAEILDSTGETLDEAVATFFQKPHSPTSRGATPAGHLSK